MASVMANLIEEAVQEPPRQHQTPQTMFLTEAKKEATEVNLSHIQWRNLPFTLYAEQKSSNWGQEQSRSHFITQHFGEYLLCIKARCWVQWGH